MKQNFNNKVFNWLRVVVFSIMILAPVVVPQVSHAQIKPPCFLGLRCEDLTLTQLLQKVISYMLGFAGLIALAFLIWGGWQYIIATGNQERAEKGRTTVVNAIIGLVIIGLSYVIVNVVINFVTSGTPNA